MAVITLSVENGSFSYKNSRQQVLKNVSFSSDSGDIVAILGPNGAGKTTLLRCIMGFLQWSGGISLLDGKNIKNIPPSELWKKISYVPQAKSTVTAYTALEMVLLGRSSQIGAFSQPRAEDIEIALSVMHDLNIEKLRKKLCSEISGGELQMVLIARALASKPKILILDEPESNLDFRNQMLILDTMSGLSASGMTCIFNTHYPAHALRYANKAFLLSKNGDYLFGDSHSVITEDNIQSAFGVRTVIGEVETPVNIIKDIIPVDVNNQSSSQLVNSNPDGSDSLAVLAIISKNYDISEKINQIFHEYSQCIVGRMGMPYNKSGVYIINATLDAPFGEIQALTAKLSLLPGVSVKATYARQG